MNANMNGTKKDTSLRAMHLAFSCEPYEDLGDGLYYCAKHNLWWKDGIVYDELSANHNGIIGCGATLKKCLKE